MGNTNDMNLSIHPPRAQPQLPLQPQPQPHHNHNIKAHPKLTTINLQARQPYSTPLGLVWLIVPKPLITRQKINEMKEWVVGMRLWWCTGGLGCGVGCTSPPHSLLSPSHTSPLSSFLLSPLYVIPHLPLPTPTINANAYAITYSSHFNHLIDNYHNPFLILTYPPIFSPHSHLSYLFFFLSGILSNTLCATLFQIWKLYRDLVFLDLDFWVSFVIQIYDDH